MNEEQINMTQLFACYIHVVSIDFWQYKVEVDNYKDNHNFKL